MVAWGRRERITAAFNTFHGAMEQVLGAADRLTAAVAQERAEAVVELVLREDGLDAARADPAFRAVFDNRLLAGAVARVAADRGTAIDAWLASGPQRLAALMDAHAPGAAGAPDGWLPRQLVDVGRVEGMGPVPQLWRIGTGAVGVGRGSGALPAAGAPSFPVGVPLLDESHLQIDARSGEGSSEPERRQRRAAAESLVEALLLRAATYFRPGLVRLHVWDVGQLTGSLPGLYPLTRTGLLTVHDPGNLEGLLEELSERIRRVHTRVLVDGQPSLRTLAAETGKRDEPWAVAVLVGDGRPLPEEDQVQRVLRGGLACGISVVLVDVPMTIGAALESVRLHSVGSPQDPTTVAITSMTGSYATVVPDPPLPRDAVTVACRAIADAHDEWRSRVATFRDLMPEVEPGKETSKARLCASIGFVEGVPRAMMLHDVSPHALVGGPSGSGKTNLLLTMICSLANRYSPDELELYLLDFKEGVSFAQFAPVRRKGGRWLPHARLVGININTDREFGLALLRYLAGVMRHRAEVAKSHEVTKLEELREVDPDGRWPRIVAVIDEFQYLFGEKDAVTNQAVQLLEDLARRGRSQGIHLVLASQDVSGIQAFWLRPAIFEQFVLRIGLPRARRVLNENNDATMHLPRWHAVVNHESGVPHGNETLRIPEATQGAVDEVLDRLYARRSEGRTEPPRLFDGSRAPEVSALVEGLTPVAGPPRALVGQNIDVDGTAATVALPAVPGRNVAVLGTHGGEAMRVLAAATVSLATQHPPDGKTCFVLAPLTAEADPAAAALERLLTGHSHSSVQLGGFARWVTTMEAKVVERLKGVARDPVYVILYAGDAGEAVLDRAQTDALRKVLRFGPEVGVHVVGWWRSTARLRSLLAMSASPDDVGAWVALDVQGAELGSLAPPGLLPVWSPRPGRALLFDRARHSQPEVVIVPAAVRPTAATERGEGAS